MISFYWKECATSRPLLLSPKKNRSDVTLLYSGSNTKFPVIGYFDYTDRRYKQMDGEVYLARYWMEIPPSCNEKTRLQIIKCKLGKATANFLAYEEFGGNFVQDIHGNSIFFIVFKKELKKAPLILFSEDSGFK